jgi:hypothetical protein
LAVFAWVALGPGVALAQFHVNDGLNLEWGGNVAGTNTNVLTVTPGDVNYLGVHTAVPATSLVFQSGYGFTDNIGTM